MPQPRLAFNTKAKLTTPPVVCRYPRLNEPDTRFDAEGRYKIEVELPKADPAVAAFLEEADQVWQQACEEGRRLGAGKQVDKAEPPWKASDDDPEVLILRAKSKTKPPVFGRDGNPYVSDDYVGGGSLVKIQVGFQPYAAGGTIGFGLTCYLNAVQVLNAVSRNSAESYGFEAVPDAEAAEGGWDSDYANAEG